MSLGRDRLIATACTEFPFCPTSVVDKACVNVIDTTFGEWFKLGLVVTIRDIEAIAVAVSNVRRQGTLMTL